MISFMNGSNNTVRIFFLKRQLLSPSVASISYYSPFVILCPAALPS